MNFFELINLTLQELNYKPVSTFSDLIKPDHKKLVTIVSRVNDILLDSCSWDFLLRELSLDVPAGAERVSLPFNMKIQSVEVDGRRLTFADACELFLSGNGAPAYYSVFDEKLLLVPESKNRKLKILYITRNHAKNLAGEEIPKLVDGTDETLLPDEHAQTALVYGACVQFKSNPQHPKYRHWLDAFTTARAQMFATREFVADQPPKVELPRWTLGYDRYHGLSF